MGLFIDLITGKKALVTIDRGKGNADIVRREVIVRDKYDNEWLNKTAKYHGLIITGDTKNVKTVLSALNKTDGHCLYGNQNNISGSKCPCDTMREYGMCRCGLFENMINVDPTGKSGAKVVSRHI